MYTSIDQDLANTLISFAQSKNYPYVVDLINRFLSVDKPQLTEFDKFHIVSFLALIKQDAQLRYPFGDDDLDNYQEADNDAFLEVVNEYYAPFANWLYDELGISVAD